MGLGTWPSALKAGHALIGLDAGVPREPVLPLDPAATATLRSVLLECGGPVTQPQAMAAE